MRSLVATWVVPALLSIAGGPVLAGSSIIEVTPENIGDLGLGLRVRAESLADSTVLFAVFVSPGRVAISPRREACVDLAERNGARAGSPEEARDSRGLACCRIDEASREGGLEYSFRLPRSVLRNARFQFRHFHPTMPSMDAYVLWLEPFARRTSRVQEIETPAKIRLLGSEDLADCRVDATPRAVEVAYDVEPNLVSMEDPVYPENAREKGIEGTVLLRVLVGEDGLVKDWIVIQSVPLLDDAAAAAARTAVFIPARKKDKPVAVWMVIPIEYRLHH